MTGPDAAGCPGPGNWKPGPNNSCWTRLNGAVAQQLLATDRAGETTFIGLELDGNTIQSIEAL